MPQSLEQQFRKASRSLRKKRRRQKAMKAGSITLTIILALGVMTLLRQGDSVMQLGGLAIGTLPLAGVLSILLLLLLIIAAWRTSFFETLVQFKRQGRFKLRYLLGFFLLGLALIFQLNARLIMNPINNVITRLVHHPQPPAVSSPWPWSAKIHDSIVKMPPGVEASIDSVADYIVQQEPDPTLRLKAAHDYVLKRLSYDQNVLTTGKRPPQDAQTVFRTGKAVCEGYSNLFQALGKSMGAKVVYVSGNVRREFAPIDIIPARLRLQDLGYDWTDHAWNAVKVQGHWQLVDTTWDDNAMDQYQTDYLMLPPQAMIKSHFPDLSSWQLLSENTSQRTFERSPILSPPFFAEQLKLLTPIEYQTKTQKTASIKIQQPSSYANTLVAEFTKVKKDEFSFWDVLQPSQDSESNNRQVSCQSEVKGQNTEFSCQLPGQGTYQVFLFSVGPQIHRLGQLKFQVS